MPAKVKFELVDELKVKLEKTAAVFVAEYRGLSVAQSTKLRAMVREANGELKVSKNTLFAKAMSEVGMEALPESMTTGPNIYALCYGDPVAVAKVMKDYAADKANQAFVLKGGMLGKTPLDLTQLKALADLPSREVLIGQTVRTIAAPLTGLVTVLSGTMRGLLTCLSQIKDQKEKTAA